MLTMSPVVGTNARFQLPGVFQLVVPAAPGHLLCRAPGADWVQRVVSDGELATGKPGGQPHFFHAVVPLHLKMQEAPKDLTVPLKRGVTLRGKLVGPDGKPVLRATLFCPEALVPARHDFLELRLSGGGRLPRRGDRCAAPDCYNWSC